MKLLHRLPKRLMEPLFKGLRKPPPTIPGRRRGKPHDAYPNLFCEAAHELIMNAITDIEGNSEEWPYASTLQMNLLADVLEDLNQKELKELEANYIEEDLPGCGHQAHSVKEVLTSPPITVANSEIKWFMNWVNSRPK